MKAIGKAILNVIISLGVVLAFVAALLFVSHLVEQHNDSRTVIEDAVVISKEKTQGGGRRSLPQYYLVIQEKDKKETTTVYVTLGAWTWCETGSIYNDVPGSRGQCETKPNP